MRVVQQHTEERSFQSVRYIRITDDTPTHSRGTVIFPDAVDREGHIFTVWGFPRIKRIYVFKRGIQRYFKDAPFVAEEKIDGYNVRLVSVQGRLLALTRGGFVCPYTTEWAETWAEEMGLQEFFQDYPDYVLCGEAIGASPYNVQRIYDVPPGLHFRLFDIADYRGRLMPPEQKYLLAAQYGIPTVPQLGRFDVGQLAALRDILLEINARGGEGVVLKSLDGTRLVKYVTPLSDLTDIQDNLGVLFDVNSGYFTNRLLRVALFVQEFGLDPEVYAQHIGQAILAGFSPLQDFHQAAEEYTILVRNITTWHALRALVSDRVRVEEVYTRPVVLNRRPYIQVGFKRVFQKSTKRFRTLLKGYGHYD